VNMELFYPMVHVQQELKLFRHVHDDMLSQSALR
jgi:hypothetical protein